MQQKLLAAAFAGAAAAVWLKWGNNALQVTRRRVVSDIDRPLRLLCLSDLHGKQFGRRNRRLIETVKRLSPDLMVFPGDTVSSDCKNLSATLLTLGELARIAPCFLIPGNHEKRSGRWEELAERIAAQGVTVLCNSRWDGVIKGVPVHILGLDEGLAVQRTDYLLAALDRLKYPESSQALQDLSRCDGARILLSHFPESFVKCGYARFDFDLQLSGHAHGGQFRLNDRIAFFAPGQGFFPRFCQGLYGSRPRLLVSRGLGNDVFIPRVNNRPEIALVTLWRKRFPRP